MILGYDGSHYDWRGWDSVTGEYYYIPINFASSQAVFVFLKACDGKYDTPFYQNAMTDARKAGKYAAPYVWLYARNHTDPKAQADFWYSRLKDEPLIAIDFEGYGDSYPDYDDLYNAIERLKADGYKGKIIIYTGYYYWLAHGSTASYWTQFPVWLARYSAYPPQPTPPFAKEIIWQFSATGDPVKYGITNGKLAVDENWFYGTDAELAELFGGEIIPPIEPPIGETMIYGTVIAEALNIRSTPSVTTTNDIGDLKLNDKIEADRKSGVWWHLTKINGIATTRESWASEGANQEYIRTDAPPAGSVKVEMYANGALIHSKDVAAGSTIRVDVTD